MKFSLPKIATAPFCPPEVSGSVPVTPARLFVGDIGAHQTPCDDIAQLASTLRARADLGGELGGIDQLNAWRNFKTSRATDDQEALHT